MLDWLDAVLKLVINRCKERIERGRVLRKSNQAELQAFKTRIRFGVTERAARSELSAERNSQMSGMQGFIAPEFLRVSFDR